MSFFHYTDAGAIISILQNQELWLTDIRFLNDSDEAKDGASYIRNAINALPSLNDEHLDAALEHLKDFTPADVISDFNDMHMFVASFSRLKDNLSQWRSYGLYAIEFHEQSLNSLAKLQTCIYTDKEKSDFALRLATSYRNKIYDVIKNDSFALSFDISQIIWELGDYVSLFKHHSFKHENEARLVTQEGTSIEGVQYRTRGNLIIPYQKLKFDLGCIKAIHVGPMKHQDMAVTAVKSIIKNVRKTQNIYLDRETPRIDVVASSIPYREF